MSDNNFVAMEKVICPICGKISDGESVLIHKRLKEITDEQAISGYDLCPEDKKMSKDGFIALIVIIDKKSIKNDKGNISIGNEKRTGEVIHIKRKLFSTIFDVSITDESEMVFISEEQAVKLKELVSHE